MEKGEIVLAGRAIHQTMIAWTRDHSSCHYFSTSITGTDSDNIINPTQTFRGPRVKGASIVNISGMFCFVFVLILV